MIYNSVVLVFSMILVIIYNCIVQEYNDIYNSIVLVFNDI